MVHAKMDITRRIFNGRIYERHILDKTSYTLEEALCPNSVNSYERWRTTERATWILRHGKEIEYHTWDEHATQMKVVTITAFVTPERWTEFLLRFY